MTISQKPNGKYKVRVYVGTDPQTGKQSYKTATANTMKEAKLKQSELEVRIANKEIVPTWEQSQPQENYTFDMAYKEWFEVYKEQDLKQSTLDRVEYYFTHYLLQPDVFGGLYFDRMTVRDIQTRANEFIGQYVSSIAIMSYAKQVFKYAVSSEHIKCDKNYLELARFVKPKKANKRETRYYTEYQAQLFEQGIREHFEHKPLYVVAFVTLLRTGIRVSELTGLQWSNLNLDDGTAVLNGRMSTLINGVHQYEDGLKNHQKERTIELDSVTVNLLRHWKHHQKQQGLIKGTGFNENDYIIGVTRNALAGTLERFNASYNKTHTEQLPWLNIHGLRHTHATLLISNGVEMKQVSDRLGHSNMMTTANTYAEVTPKARREVADVFSRILEN